MALIRLQDKVPEVYADQSRDFQLLLRLYDVILNGLKYDIDGVKRAINTHDCKSNLLQLLQTKLGFFTSQNFIDTTLRNILEGFPLLVKKKGTKTAIEEAVYLYLKIANLQTAIKVDIIEDKPTWDQKLLFGANVTDHSVVIGIESFAQDLTPLKEMLKYIIPFGYNLYFYFFVGTEKDDIIYYKDKAKFVLVSNDINSALMGSSAIVNTVYSTPTSTAAHNYSEYWQDGQYKSDTMEQLVSAVNMIEIGVHDTKPDDVLRNTQVLSEGEIE